MTRTVSVLVLSALIAIGTVAGADVINGTFSQARQLSGWTVNDEMGVYWDPFDEAAVLSYVLPEPGADDQETGGGLPVSILSQLFVVDSGSSMLQFSIWTPGFGGGETDVFSASLQNSEFLNWNSATGFENPQSGVTISDPDLYGWRTVSLTLPGGLDEQWVDLRFELSHDYDDLMDTRISIDNVELVASVVPGPSALLLAAIGSVVAVRFRQK